MSKEDMTIVPGAYYLYIHSDLLYKVISLDARSDQIPIEVQEYTRGFEKTNTSTFLLRKGFFRSHFKLFQQPEDLDFSKWV